jgi:hypothetical protein
MVWRRDHCPQVKVPPTKAEKDFDEAQFEKFKETMKADYPSDASEAFDETDSQLRGQYQTFMQTCLNPDGWLVRDRLWIARSLHEPKNKTLLVDNEAYLQGWSEKLFSSDDTRKLWKRGIKKRKMAGGCEST